MAQTGYTPILIYSSSTGGNSPAAGNLTNSTLGSELAINITDGKLFYKDNANAIQVIGWKVTPTTAGGTGLTSYTAGDLVYYASGTTLSKLAIGANTNILTSSGTAPQWSAASSITVGTATNIAGGAAGSVPYQTGAGATSLLAIGSAYQALQVNAGGTAPSWQPSATSVLTTQGDLLYASAANTLARLAKNTTASRYLSNGGTSNNPSWAQVDLTNGVTGTLPVGNGGTGLSTLTANRILYASATDTVGTSANFTYNGTDVSLTSGNYKIATGNKGITSDGGWFVQNSASVASGGTLDLTMPSSGFVGILSVSNTRDNYTPQSRRVVYGIACYGTTVNTTQLHIQDGTGGGPTFSLSVPSAGTLRWTDTSGDGSTHSVYLTFSGSASAG